MIEISRDTNVLSAIANIYEYGDNDLSSYSESSKIRINAVGEQLEYYMKDSLANSFEKAKDEKDVEYQEVFSWLGNQNNPPDFILDEGDAFEIKKIESPKSALALNSSPPKDVLYSSDPRVTNGCKICENRSWNEKDLFYVIGHVYKKKIKYLFFVHGLCYAAKKDVYNRLHSGIKESINETLESQELEIGNTVELGRVKRVDPLGITDLRIRGMWHIQNPINVYSYVYSWDEAKQFSLVALMKKEKFLSFPDKDRERISNIEHIEIEEVKLKDPNNPAKFFDSTLIKFER